MQGFLWQLNQLVVLASDIECSRSVGFRMFDRNCSFGHVLIADPHWKTLFSGPLHFGKTGIIDIVTVIYIVWFHII